jgi:DNA repair protein RadD
MNLRPYQQQLHDTIAAAWQSGIINVLAVLPTGGGKTVTFSHIVREEPGASIVLAHRAELVAQMSLALAREGVRHRIIGPPALIRLCVNGHMGELRRSFYDANAKTGVASVQSVTASKGQGEWFKQVRLWVHDEAHHLLSDNQFGKAVAHFPNARGLGVTATPGRADGRGLGRHADGLFDTMLTGPTPRWLIEQGFLSQYKIFAPPSNLDLSAVHVTASGEYSPPELKLATQKSTVLGDTVSHYVKHAFGKSGLTFADSVENATDIAQRYREAGVSAEVLTGKTPDTLRANVIGRFKNKQLLQIVSVALIDEGFDCPGVEVVSDAAATQSFNRFAQRFGRGLRVMEGKTHMIYLDHVGNTIRHGLPDAQREWSLDRRDRKRAKKSDAIPLRICVNVECIQPYERIHKCCPYCGYYPPPPLRSGPEYVDGDLLELDEATLAALRAQIAKVDGDAVVPYGAAPEVVGAVRRRHWERREAQSQLRNVIAWWAGLETAQGREDSESYRRFYYKFGIDAGTAQTLGAREAGELAERVGAELSKLGIDGSVNVDAYLT